MSSIEANEEQSMMKKTMQQLCSWVLDEGKTVTSSYLLKNTPLNVVQVQRLLNEFVDHNVTDERISLSFFLLGEVEPGYDQADGIDCLKSTICRQQELEQTKGLFKSIDSCSIYSVQAKPIRDFQSLFNVNWCMEDSPHLSPVKNKSLIWNSAAHDFYTRWKESRQDDLNRRENVSKHLLQKEMLRNAAKVDGNKISNDKARDGKATCSLFKNEGKTLMEKKQIPIIDACESSPQTKRQKKILIDNEEEDEEDGQKKVEDRKKESDPVQTRENMEVDEATSSTHAFDLIANDTNDLYCTGGDLSPEREAPQRDCAKLSGNKPSKSKKLSQGTKKLQRLLAKTEVLSDEEDDSMPYVQQGDSGELEAQQSKTITTFRHEKVTDTYVDEDGFTVTRTVPKLVETQEVVTTRPQDSQRPVLKASNTVNSKPSKAKVARGQPTISSFFTKK